MNKPSKTTVWTPFAAAILFVVGMWLGYMLSHGPSLSPAREKLNSVFELIESEYVDEIDPDSLVELVIPALLNNLDPHSVYIPVSELDRMNRDLESSFFGIGVQFQIMNDSICVVEVISGGPAERMGLKAGDRIIAVDGKDMTGSSVTNEDVFSSLRGDRGTSVDVTVKRTNSAKPVKFTITRDEIPSVSIDAAYIIDGNTGYIKVNKFAANTYSEFVQAIHSLRHKGAQKFILDLRGNTGGLLDQAILMVNEFLAPMQNIVEVRGRIRADNASWLSDGTGSFALEDLVVLTDEFSASCSEIVAGAIQDNDRGLIIGRRTFGKGLVQRPIVLADSSQIRLTVQRYYTPSGRCIQKVYKPGQNSDYESEILDRYTNGEVFSADSTKFDSSKIFHTLNGRTVYGGGGIMPDVFVPSDTTGMSSYYINVANAGLLQQFAYEYADLNRNDLNKAKSVSQLLAKLPPEQVLLSAFVNYAAQKGIAPRWYYINISQHLIVNQLRALIARDILGTAAYYEITNEMDPVMTEARRQLSQGISKTLKTQSKK